MADLYNDEDEVVHLKKFIVYEHTKIRWSCMATSEDELYASNGTDESDYFAVVEEASGISFYWDEDLDNWTRNE